MESELGQELREVDHSKVVLGSSIVGFVQLNEVLNQQRGLSDKGLGRARVSKRPKLLTNEGRIKPTGSKGSVLSKRSHREIDSEVGSEIESKKSRNADITNLLVEAGS